MTKTLNSVVQNIFLMRVCVLHPLLSSFFAKNRRDSGPIACKLICILLLTP